MNNGSSNGTQYSSVHVIEAYLDAVLQYDQNKTESGSGKMGTLCVCRHGVSHSLTGIDNSNICHHKSSECNFFVSTPNIMNCFLSSKHEKVDLAEYSSIGESNFETLTITCKDFKELVLHLPKKDEEIQSFCKALHDRVFGNVDLPCFNSHSTKSKSCTSSFLDKKSWEKELGRLKINSGKNKWKVVENKHCEFISDYVVVPNALSLESLIDTGKTHFNFRFMTWCWTDSETMVSLLRCSEPQTILNNSYLNKILNTVNNGKAKTHAVMSTARLKDSCPNEEMLRISFEKLWNACLVKDCDSFFKYLESSKWLNHIQSFIRASRHIARTLKCDKNPVVVIDETGRDVSCLVVSLVQVLTDDYFRTITGFASLVNKEWVASGYAFQLSLMAVNRVDTNFLPTFLMFLDCVHNVLVQYPTEFEFTEMYLIEIIDTILGGESELFKFNCPKNISLFCRGKESELVDDIWCRVWEHKSEYRNSLFNLKDEMFSAKYEESPKFDEDTHQRTSSYSYAVGKPYEVGADTKKKRHDSFMLKAIKKPSLRIFSKKKKKKKKSSFFSTEKEPPRQRLTSIKNIFKSKFDPINVNYSLINIELWDNYFFRHARNPDCHQEMEPLLNKFVSEIKCSYSEMLTSQCSEDSSDVEGRSDLARMSLAESDLPLTPELIPRSDSQSTLNSERMERSIHVSDIDLCNDHVDRDNESPEELSLNGLEASIELNSVPTISISETDKRLSHVIEEPEMSNTKSPLAVELEIAEAANDIQDF